MVATRRRVVRFFGHWGNKLVSVLDLLRRIWLRRDSLRCLLSLTGLTLFDDAVLDFADP